MAVNFQVRAGVVDLANHLPARNETFLVDTNVWFWTAYPRLSDPALDDSKYQVRAYPGCLGRIRKAGGKPFWCGLTFSELAHRVEEAEYQIWKRLSQVPARDMATPKEFRHNFAAERASVVQTINTVWGAVTGVGEILSSPVTIDATATEAARDEMGRCPLDGYDMFLLQTARRSGIRNIISDDGDLCCVPDITLFTCNRAVIGCASAQGRLIG
jgi:predicted nucleic acid-binding protein